ncbi:hypothetical protein Lalb_Chr17g0339531 [Lupinus albus]|uniref:Uncharacterized protein n=1 Tax=Lupinus albus TaxID=3870 RepID=A0A6A4P835_LUPAL|nr:hypothetical protein Lalb_Chr17g0339531 [Lupinus albus]
MIQFQLKHSFVMILITVMAVEMIMQSIGFLGPAFFLTQLSHVRTPAMEACDSFSQFGLHSNHQNIGPRYAGILLGLSNATGVLAGVFGTSATGYILERGENEYSTHILLNLVLGCGHSLIYMLLQVLEMMYLRFLLHCT